MSISRPTVTDAGPRARCGASEVIMREPVSRRANGLGLPSAPVSPGPGSKPEAAVRPLIEASRGLSFIVLSNARRRKQRHMPVLLHRGRRRAAKTPPKDGTRRLATSRRTSSTRRTATSGTTKRAACAPRRANPVARGRAASREPNFWSLPSYVSFTDRLSGFARDDWRLGLAGPRGSS